MSVILGGIVYGYFIRRAIRRVRGTYSEDIVRQLRETGQPVVVMVSDRRGTWNPARKEVSGRLFANGRVTYSLDESGIVHLTFISPAGDEQRYEGPIPAWHDSPKARRRQRFQRRVLMAHCAWLLVGFGLGCVLADGSVGKRLLIGLVGMLIALILLSIVSTVIRVAMAVRLSTRSRRSAK